MPLTFTYEIHSLIEVCRQISRGKATGCHLTNKQSSNRLLLLLTCLCFCFLLNVQIAIGLIYLEFMLLFIFCLCLYPLFYNWDNCLNNITAFMKTLKRVSKNKNVSIFLKIIKLHKKAGRNDIYFITYTSLVLSSCSR